MSDDNPPNISGPALDDRTRRLRRLEQRKRRRTRRLWAAPVAIIVSIAAIVALSAGGGPSKSGLRSGSASGPASGGLSASGETSGGNFGSSGLAPAAVVSGGPLAPVAVGGRVALWAPENVVDYQPGTAAAYGAASKLSGLPGYLLIADRANNRILVVNPQHRIVFKYPSAADLAAGRRLFYNDDTFV